MRRHFELLRQLCTRPSLFFGEVFLDPDRRAASRFALRNGLLLAVALGLVELAVERSFSWTWAAVSLILLVTLPIVFLAASFLWALFLRAAGLLLGVSIPVPMAFTTSAYSTAGLLLLVFSGPWAWLALAVVPLQVLALERAMNCARFRSAILVVFPFSVAALFFLFFTIMFEVF